jgi:hypothetical protein
MASACWWRSSDPANAADCRNSKRSRASSRSLNTTMVSSTPPNASSSVCAMVSIGSFSTIT